ncbi:TIGR00730 family Rossman fold protein [Acinetobacter haemolyticus]|uniref:Cytokinin riboside 5'-monophosphate phosphoribohydrolase n=2 Tax=Acinetobacter haemolyticus TaxID=29430 RepID=A0A2K8PU61_ACIHA|nr:TIGR00730 family Rossman fold protein [Acinetobacter haemolyticus]ATZ66274.1 Rossman fold protein, TIGR00730 family [Acinetobacter haemolyticus]ENW22400.1 TIGR00730 family protein [Acinetobacter haemolyticus NIPH 261]NAR62724.1 TIGR00730 family Rossman fold protein [Acinetobacter haemolyticus]NCU23963.1 TIGR00730 family Rossman fold protein [Acinetobacter haemolyticus]QHI09027.1 TIGR00730 family Rossman fold protein [Acinetobacter haemolyticus]
MNSICVFCGSSLGNDPIYQQMAQATGQAIAEQGKTLIYGGGRSGLMGVVADSALKAGGRVVGIIPNALVDRELAHKGLTELYVVDNMHERKTQMSEQADAFIALPGGAGTLEEIFEQWTWNQLGIHQKPCAFLNVGGFYDDLIKMIQGSVARGFSQSRFVDQLIVANDINEILTAFSTYQPATPKWMSVDEIQA